MLVDENGKEYGSRAFAGDAGIDLTYRTEDPTFKTYVLSPGERKLFATGAWIAEGELDGGVGLVFGRSGLANKHGVTLTNSVGVIDSGYRGEILVNLINLGSDPVPITDGDRIAQFVAIPLLAWTNVGEVRGAGGHGSSGR